jgi:hypothetical protein
LSDITCIRSIDPDWYIHVVLCSILLPLRGFTISVVILKYPCLHVTPSACSTEDRDFQINILPPTPLELFQLFIPISLVQSWVYYSDSWVSHLTQNGVIDSHSSAISDHSRINRWDGLSAAQVYVWLGVLIYLGIHKENTIKSHWSSLP